jgi:DNA mismatch repair protein MutS
LPDAVVERARAVLRQLEEGEMSGKAAALVDDLPLFSVAARREPPKATVSDALAEAVQALHPDEMTPREALEALYRLKELTAKR